MGQNNKHKVGDKEMNKEEFDKLCNAHKQANAGAKQIQEATHVLIMAGFNTEKISFLMIDLAKAFRENLQEIVEQAQQKEAHRK